MSFLSAEVDAPHMLLLQPNDDVQPGDIYDSGTWTRPEPPPIPEPPLDPEPSTQDQIDQLAIENANLKVMIEEKDRENKNALFEIYSMLLGGM